MVFRIGVVITAFALGLAVSGSRAVAQSRYLEVRYTPTKRAQVAIWIESADGTFLRTILLTESVGLRGIGNRPGALQMNSGFRWPYGRREGVLPIWAHRRAAAPNAMQFPRVVFQNRREGYASQSTADQSRDRYFCLSFDDSNNDDVDATSCASVFNSDKGRFITDEMIQDGYGEPYQAVPGTNETRVLGATSLYPMRRDLSAREGYDTVDVLAFASTARAVMPEIDVVTRATAASSSTQLAGVDVPDSWPEGDYVVWVEVNTERDFSAGWTEAMHPTPATQGHVWDSWAATYGYAYRGQPSVVYRVPIRLDSVERRSVVADAEGYGELEGLDGEVRPIDASIANDPTNAPGSGVDRLLVDGGARVVVQTAACMPPPPIPAIPPMAAAAYGNESHSHEWATLRFQAIGIAGRPIANYRVKVSTTPITDDASFDAAEDAKATTLDFQGIEVCPVDPATGLSNCPDDGTMVQVDVGKLTFQTTYHVAVRAIGPCGVRGPITSAEFATSEIHFTTVAPCFVATAAFGSPLARDVASLRAFRDRELMPTSIGRGFVAAYYRVGPSLADAIRGSDALRSLARAALRPFVQLARITGASDAPP